MFWKPGVDETNLAGPELLERLLSGHPLLTKGQEAEDSHGLQRLHLGKASPCVEEAWSPAEGASLAAAVTTATLQSSGVDVWALPLCPIENEALWTFVTWPVCGSWVDPMRTS